jgi:hypothetical protein
VFRQNMPKEVGAQAASGRSAHQHIGVQPC